MRKGWLFTSDASEHKRKSKHSTRALWWKDSIKQNHEHETPAKLI